jgi:hypothetical protein
MFSPLHPLARAEVFNCSLFYMKEVLHYGIRPRKINVPIRIGKTERQLLTQRVLAARGSLFRVAARRLISQPFPNVTLVGIRVGRELG